MSEYIIKSFKKELRRNTLYPNSLQTFKSSSYRSESYFIYVITITDNLIFHDSKFEKNYIKLERTNLIYRIERMVNKLKYELNLAYLPIATRFIN